jgi:hypothetical protein
MHQNSQKIYGFQRCIYLQPMFGGFIAKLDLVFTKQNIRVPEIVNNLSLFNMHDCQAFV